MAHKLRFHRSIPDDLVEAINYYEQISPTLAGAFRANVNRRLDDIAETPELFPFDQLPVRFAKIERFPYLIFFTAKAGFIAILAIVHGASDPQKWRSRV